MATLFLMPVDHEAQTAPGTPASGFGRVYFKGADKHLHQIDDAGVDTDLAASSPPSLSTVEAILGSVAPATTSQVQQQNGSSASSASLVVILGTLPTTGNTLIVVVGGNGGFLTGVSGGGVASWAHAVRAGSSDDCELWWGLVGASPSTAITITPPSAERIVAKVMEYNGALTPDQSHTASGTSVSIDPGSITPTQPNELVIALGVAFQTISAGPTGGFHDEGTVASATFSMGVATLQQGPALAADTAWTIPSSGWDAGIVSFTYAASGSIPVSTPQGIPALSGTFDITGLTGLTAGKPVAIWKAAGPYDGKGTLADEAEMDTVTAEGYVVNATTVRVYWTASAPQIGDMKFNYLIGA